MAPTPTVIATTTQPPVSNICPPENITFPAPDDLENHIGWQYLSKPGAFNYPQAEFGSLITIDGREYGFSGYKLKGDQSYMFVLEKILCYESVTHQPAWEIVDAVRTQPQTQGSLQSCSKNNGSSETVICLFDSSDHNIINSAWSVDTIEKR